ncbi:EAL domain-containing protein [Marinobacter fonticola]|uniref:EAL domain-containing protein n=1 Tax=Marinobacter fonticola TaxID=2603215 RepID=UPI0011E6880E|nr:EAL domain-containing protein [Marinobacter fonticola]
MRQSVVFFVLLGVLMTAVSGVQANLVDDGYIEPAIEYIRLPYGQTDSAGPVEINALDRWQRLAGDVPNFGYVRDVVWLRFDVPTPAGALDQMLEIRYPQLDSVQIFLFENGRPVKQMTTGDWLPMSTRPIQHPHFLMPYRVNPDSRYHFLVRVQTDGALQVPTRLWQRDVFFGHTSQLGQAHAIYYGILITVVFFNLFVFLAMREATYLYYALSTLGYLFLLGSLHGTTYPLLWPDSPWLQNQSMMMSVPIAMLFSLLFARSFLNLHSRNPAWDRFLRGAVIANLLAILGTFLLGYNTSMQVSVALAIPCCLLLTVVGPVEWARGNRQAILYTIAWGVLTVGSALTAANKFGWIPTNFVTEFGMELGSALEAILLTIGLAMRLYQEREDKVAARESQLRALAARRNAELRMMDQALHHPLTKLPNRTSFELHLQDLMIREPQRRHAVGVVQLTNLAAITKTLGHQNAERILELAAQSFNHICQDLPGVRTIEQDDTRCFHAASLESGTFGFIIDADAARAQPRKILECLEAVRAPVDYLGMQLPLDPLAGVAIYPNHSDDPSTLIRQAYIALESGDALDRGLAYYRSELDSYNASNLTLASELRQAIRQNDLTLFFQPKLALADQRVVGVEALIRWPSRGEVTADQIVAVAEQTGLIKPFTRWVLQQAVKARDGLIAAGHGELSVAVNISPNNLREQDFPLFVQRLMSNHPEHAGKIILEVTETSMMQDPANSLRALRSLDFAGIPLSIDDFGSGYSSLSYIKRLPAGEIKIDRSLIVDLALQAEDRVIVQTTITMCHDLGYKVVAEGVEDEATMQVLRDMRCDMIQGFVLTPPQPMDDFMRWLTNQGMQAKRRA